MGYFEIVRVKSGGDDFAMESPFWAIESEETVAFELFNEWMSFVFLVQMGVSDEDFSDHIRVGYRNSRNGSEPNHKRRA